MPAKKIIIIAGPNGAGKTTFARAFLPEEAQCPHFINADLIAAGKAKFEHHYRALVDAWALYDNSGDEPVMIEWGER